MAEDKLQIIIEAVDNVSGKLKEIEGNVQKTADSSIKQFALMGAAIFVATKAFQVISDVVKDGIAAYAKQEDAINRLNFALKNQGQFTVNLSEQYQDMATSLQKSTRYSDDAILELQQTLVSIGNVAPSQMNRVVKATLDFATATGTNLATAQDIMSKAAAGNTAMLGRYGIILDQNIPKSLKFSAALGFIEQRFGGAAQEDVKSFSGQMEQLKNQWDGFLETVGKFVVKLGILKVGIDLISNALQFYGKILNDVTSTQREFSSDAVKSMYERIDAIDKEIKIEKDLQKAGSFRADQEKTINDLLINRQRIVDTIKRLETKTEQDNSAKNALIQSQQASENTKKKLKDDAEEIAAAFKAELEVLNQIESGFKAGKVSSEDYYQAIIGNQSEVEFRNNRIAPQIEQLAELNRMQADSQLMEEQRVNQGRIDLLNAYQTNFVIAHQQMGSVVATLSGSMRTDLSGALTSIITGAQSARQAFTNMGQAMLKAIVDVITQQIAAFVIEQGIILAKRALNIGYIAAQTASAVSSMVIIGTASAVQAAATAAAWAPAAALVSLANFGANAAPATDALTSTVALAKTIATLSALGLASGTDTVPAMLSPGEMVFPRSMADAIRAGDISVSGGGNNSSGGGDVNIYMSGVTINSKENVRELAEELGFEIDRKLRNARSNV